MAAEGSRRTKWIFVLVPAVLAAVVYAQMVQSTFLYDDKTYVIDNQSIGEGGGLEKIWTSSYPPHLPDRPLYRPMTATSYLLDHKLFGLHSGGFHATNFLLHALATALLTILVFQLGGTSTTACCSGRSVAVHPVHTAAVAWVVGRAEILACLACFGATLFWIRFRRQGRWYHLVLSVGCYFLGLASKEIAAPLPALLLLGDFFGLFGERKGQEQPGVFSGQGRRRLEPYVLFGMAFVVYAAIRIAILGRFGMSEVAQTLGDESSWVRWLTAFASVGKYAQLLLLPVDLRIDYTHFKIASLWDLHFLLGFLGLIGLAVFSIRGRRRFPVIVFCLIWFFLFILPVTNLIVLVNVTVAERFLYISSASACVLAGMLVDRLLRWKTKPIWRWLRLSGLVMLLLGFTAMTLLRNRDWQDAGRFWQVAAEQAPRSEKMLLGLSSHILLDEAAWKREQDLQEAERLLRTALGFRPESEHRFSENHLLINLNLAKFLAKRGRGEDSLEQYQRLARLCRRFYPKIGKRTCPEGLMSLGIALYDRSDYDGDIRSYQDDMAARPGCAEALVNLANAFTKQNRFEEALPYYRKVIEENPGLEQAYVNHSLVLLQMNRKEEALKVIQGFPTNRKPSPSYIYTKAYMLEQLGRCRQAKREYERVPARSVEYGRAQSAIQKLGDCNP